MFYVVYWEQCWVLNATGMTEAPLRCRLQPKHHTCNFAHVLIKLRYSFFFTGACVIAYGEESPKRSEVRINSVQFNLKCYFIAVLSQDALH